MSDNAREATCEITMVEAVKDDGRDVQHVRLTIRMSVAQYDHARFAMFEPCTLIQPTAPQ